MKSNLHIKVFITVCFSLIALLTISACKDGDVYAESSDFDLYPDSWNDFNKDNGDIYVSDTTTTAEDETSSDDWTANFFGDEDEVTSGNMTVIIGNESENDSTVESGSQNGNNSENTDNNDSTPSVDDTESDTTTSSDSSEKEGPFVPLK